jgi:hypothetical protein
VAGRPQFERREAGDHQPYRRWHGRAQPRAGQGAAGQFRRRRFPLRQGVALHADHAGSEDQSRRDGDLAARRSADDPKDGIVIDDFDYVDRSVEKIKVVNPAIPRQYVIVERILKVMFVDRRPDATSASISTGRRSPSETQDHTGG